MATLFQEKRILTYSALSTFRNCPRKYKNRFEDHLRPVGQQPVRYFGQVIHQALTLWYRRDKNLKPVYEYIESCFEENRHERILACVMMTAYAERYPTEEFEVIGLDVEFAGEIRNPKTTGRSQTFIMAGKANGIVELDGELWLLEHRTASTSEEIDPDRLWADTQSALYCHYLRQNGYPIVGVIHNILIKSRIREKQGESDQESINRFKEWYQTHDAFQRIAFRFSEDRMELLQEEIWEVTQQYLGSRRREQWLLNTSNCFHYNRPCEYLKYCRSGFNLELCEILFEHVLPHEELPILGLNLRPEEQKRYEQICRQKELQQNQG